MPNLPFKLIIPPLPLGFNGTWDEYSQFLSNSAELEVPSGVLLGHIGPTIPADNSGPWLKDGKTWYIWDPVTLAYVPQEGHVDIGEVTFFASETIDSDRYLLADGTAVSRDTYSALFDKIGLTFGKGDGSTTFNLPNVPGKTLIGAGTGSMPNADTTKPPTALTARKLGDQLGEEKHALTPSEVPALTTAQVKSGTGIDAVTTSGADGAAHQNMQPSIALVAVIRHA